MKRTAPFGAPDWSGCGTMLGLNNAEASKEDAKQIARLLPTTGAQYSDDVVKDACEVGDRILKLVDDLGISPGTLSDRGVSRDEIPIIVGRACGGITEGPTYDAVFRLVESLF